MKKIFVYIAVVLIVMGSGISVRYLQTYGTDFADFSGGKQLAGTLFSQTEGASTENIAISQNNEEGTENAADPESVSSNDSKKENTATAEETPDTTNELTDNQTTNAQFIIDNTPQIPNLTVLDLVVEPSSMQPNAKVRITATIENTGTASAQGVLGRLENITNGYHMGVHPPYDFAPGQKLVMWEEDDSPFFAVCSNGGTNVLRFIIDFNNEVAESNETDNAREIAVQLLGCQ